MANKYQESLLTAIDILVNSRIDDIQMDKTVTATITKCTNALTGEYQVRYSGGNMLVYAQDNTTYSEKTEVYVLVPLGDFTKKKMILGKAQKGGEDDNISFVASALNNYNIVGTNSIRFKDKPEEVGLHSYLKEDYQLIYQRGDEEHSLVTVDQLALENSIKNADALYLETSFSTRLPKEHRLSAKGVYGITFNLAFKDGNDPNKVKTVAYVIDSNSMTGNPLQFLTWSDQFNIFEIDTENFLYIESIMAFSKDFVVESNYQQAQFHGVDIKLKEFEIYGLKEVAAVNGDYKLKISTPIGNTFKTIAETEQLTVVGRVTHKENTNLSDATTFYWFVEDSRVTSASEEYNMYGGVGWRYLEDKGNNSTLRIKGNENRAYVNRYRCAAVYKSNVILKDEFIIYNEASKRDLSITSSLGEKFSFDRGKPTLTCLVNGYESDFERDSLDEFPHTDNLYKFVWSKTDQQGNTVIFNRTAEDIQKDIDELKEEGEINFSVLNYLTQQKIELQDVKFIPGENKITYPVKQISNFEIFTCEVFLKDHISQDDSEAYSIGSASITLQNATTVNEPDYSIVIENGDQVFQYSVDGISPKADRNKEPITIKPLSVKFYDPAGEEIDQRTYLWRWLVPLENTLIVAPKEGMVTNPATNKIEHSVSPHYPLDIKEYYDFSALNNQIEVLIDYNGKQFRKRTNLTFSKVGENGTNGTDIVARVNPLADVPIGETLAATLDKGTLNMSDGNTLSYSIPGWNYGTGDFYLDLFYKNELKAYTENTKWTMAPNNSWCNAFSAASGSSNSGGKVTVFTEFTNSSNKKVSTNYILRGNVAIDGKDYYGFYNVPLIIYNNGTYVGDQPTKENRPYTLHIDWDKTLKQVLYNRDGHNPMYNRNQGVFISLEKNESSGTKDIRPYVVFETIGGTNNNQSTAEIKIAREQKAKESDLKTKISPATELADEQTTEDAIVEAETLGQIEALFVKADIKIKATTDFYNIDSYWQELDNQMIDILKAKKKYSDPIHFPKFVFYYKGTLLDSNTIWTEVEMRLTSKSAFQRIVLNSMRIHQIMIGELAGTEDDIKKYQEKNKEAFEVINKDQTPYTVALETDITPIEEYLVANRKKIYEVIDHVYVYPDEVYSGEYMNHCVLVSIYENAEIKTPFIQAYIPIYMSLNTYGLQSLNAWDGNHIEINKENNYILAPQIGAGKKNNANQFTGVLMGTAQWNDAAVSTEATELTGLFGFAEGKQSIFLDAETGNATFGLPAKQSTSGNNYQEGRIELRPGGESKIGNWRIGNASLYNSNNTDLIKPYDIYLQNNQIWKNNKNENEIHTVNGSIGHDQHGLILNAEPPFISVKGDMLTKNQQANKDDAIEFGHGNTIVETGDSLELQLTPLTNSPFAIFRHTIAPETGVYTFNESTGVISLESGIKLEHSVFAQWITSNKQWRFIKSDNTVKYVIYAVRQIRTNTDGIDRWVFKTAEIGSGVQTNKYYYFTANSETGYPNVASNILTPYWHRENKVGIDTKGRFFTNSLKDGNTAFSISNVAAFDKSANTGFYAGGQFELFNKVLFKIFSPTAGYTSNSTVYLSGANTAENEYSRPISIHGSQLSVYTNDGVNTNKTNAITNSRLIVSNAKYELGNNNTLLQLNNSGKVELKTTSSQLIDIHNTQGNLQVGSGIVFTTKGNKTETITGNSTDTSNNKTITGNSATTINGNNSTIDLRNNYIDLHSNSNAGRLLLHSSNASYLYTGSSLGIHTGTYFAVRANRGSVDLRTAHTDGWCIGETNAEGNKWVSRVFGDEGSIYLNSSNGSIGIGSGVVYTTTNLKVGSSGALTIYGHDLDFNDSPGWEGYNGKSTVRQHLAYIYSILAQHVIDIQTAATKANWNTINGKPTEYPPSSGSSYYAPSTPSDGGNYVSDKTLEKEYVSKEIYDDHTHSIPGAATGVTLHQYQSDIGFGKFNILEIKGKPGNNIDLGVVGRGEGFDGNTSGPK